MTESKSENNDQQQNIDYTFSIDDRAEIDYALEHFLEMGEGDRDALIADIERTGTFRVFGYGSLMGAPHADPDEEYTGELPGWKRDVYCQDRHYRGTPNELGVTMGAEPCDDEGATLRGVVQVQKAEADDNTPFKDRVLQSIHQFALRETSANPIYAYKVVDIKAKDHGTVKSVICAADPKNPLYLGGQPVPVYDENGNITGAEGLSVEEKASIIGSSRGAPGASPRNTGLDYWQFILHCTYEAGQEPEPHILEMVQLANAYRQQLPEAERLELEEIEAKNPAREHYDKRVFESAGIHKIIGSDLAHQDLERGKLSRVHARNVLGSDDPLSEQRLEVVEKNRVELESILSIEPT